MQALDAVFLFIGPYSAVPPPQGAQTKKSLANKAAAKKAESSDSSDSSDEAEQVPSKAEAGRLWGEAAGEVLHCANKVYARSWLPQKSHLSLLYVAIYSSGNF